MPGIKTTRFLQWVGERALEVRGPLEVKARAGRESIARVLRTRPPPSTFKLRRKPTAKIAQKKSTNSAPAKPPPAPNQRRIRRKKRLSKNTVQFSTTLWSNPANSRQPNPKIPAPCKVKPSEKRNPRSEHSAQNAPLQANIQPLGATLPATLSPRRPRPVPLTPDD